MTKVRQEAEAIVGRDDDCDASDLSSHIRAEGVRMQADSSGAPQTRRALMALVAENYPVIAHELLRPILDLHSISRQACGGDADKFIIMLVVAVRTTEDKRFSGYTQEQLLSGEVPVFPSLGTNVRSIADSIGVPRETVRRKVRELIAAGWIDRDGDDLRFTALAYQRLASARIAIEHLAIRHFEVVTELIHEHALDGGASSQEP